MDLLVADLDENLTESSIQKLFEVFGTVTRVKLIRDKKTGKSKGFGFVSMEVDEDAERAIEGLNGKEIAGTEIAVKISTGKPKKKKRKRIAKQKISSIKIEPRKPTKPNN